ncbi:MAG: hypothetical protein EXS09_20430 [Gemmataceae bacterium]|nr:hypothetical protein [Gemmataceae bacterium]
MFKFITSLPDEERLSVKKSLGLVKENATPEALKGLSLDMREIQHAFTSATTNIVERLGKDSATHPYHHAVVWLAEISELSESTINVDSTFAIERALMKRVFAELWDKLDGKKRAELLKKIDPNGKIKDHTAVALLGGRSVVAALMVTSHFAGFALYTAMSTTICTVAGWLGITLPFAVYTSASSIVAFLCGPVGWAILAVAGVVTLAIAGRAERKKTAAFVFQMHLLKVAALKEAGIPESEIYTPSVNFPGGGRIESNRKIAKEWETFTIENNKDSTVSFSAYTGYLCAKDGGGRGVIANRDVIGDWERWELLDNKDGTVNLRTKTGLYLCVDDTGRVSADRKTAADWEKFRLVKDLDGKVCSIKCWRGTYLSAQPE